MKKILTKTTLIAVALAFAACSATPVRRSMKEGWNDTLTAEKIRYKLMRNDQVKKSHMHVEVFRGQVTLTGRALTDAEKNRAEAVAKSVKKVTGVENFIHVVGPTTAPVASVAQAGKAAVPGSTIQEKIIVTEKIKITEDELPATIPTIREGTGTGKTVAQRAATSQLTKPAKPDAKLATVQKSAAAKKAVAKAPIKKTAPAATAVVKKAAVPVASAAAPSTPSTNMTVMSSKKEMVPMNSSSKVVGQAKTGLPWDGEVYEDDASSVKSKAAATPVATRTPVPTKAVAPQVQAAAPAAVTGSDDLAKEAAQELEKLRQKK